MLAWMPSRPGRLWRMIGSMKNLKGGGGDVNNRSASQKGCIGSDFTTVQFVDKLFVPKTRSYQKVGVIKMVHQPLNGHGGPSKCPTPAAGRLCESCA